MKLSLLRLLHNPGPLYFLAGVAVTTAAFTLSIVFAIYVAVVLNAIAVMVFDRREARQFRNEMRAIVDGTPIPETTGRHRVAA